jgi:L-ascorbate metabolism protein UlaG (beta-lactamase superfamily)
MKDVKLTLIGGPTVLIELGGLRLLTDPTFDPAGGDYHLGPVTLHKMAGPARSVADLGPIDAVLLSHEQHSDNLDQAGRDLLPTVPYVFTTPESAAKLGAPAQGLAPWASAYLTAPGGRRLKITATPCRHGPVGAEAYSGEVTGFVLEWDDDIAAGAVYVAGDTVWYEGVAEVARRFDVRVALVNLGAAQLDLIGPVDLTMNAAGAVETARAFAGAVLVPAHYEGWAHFREPAAEVARVFAEAGLTNRLLWLKPGITSTVG